MISCQTCSSSRALCSTYSSSPTQLLLKSNGPVNCVNEFPFCLQVYVTYLEVLNKNGAWYNLTPHPFYVPSKLLGVGLSNHIKLNFRGYLYFWKTNWKRHLYSQPERTTHVSFFTLRINLHPKGTL